LELNINDFRGGEEASRECPNCHSKKNWKDGPRETVRGSIQRYICRDCGYRFSQPVTKNLNLDNTTNDSSQLCAEVEAKKLDTATETKTVAGESTTYTNKILEYAWWSKKNGNSEATIEPRVKLLNLIVKRGANLYDPETVKEVIATQTWCNGRKNNAADAYSSFLKMTNGTWEAPTYKKIRKLPFIPKETEIDQLIAGCSKKLATFLQMLKETGARRGEIWTLTWDDIDFESKVVNITPEKGSNPRVIHLSNKLLEMLSNLKKIYGNRVFSTPEMNIEYFAINLQRQRKKISVKIGNQRLLRIHFHTFRYWKGTMLYHETKDMYYVMQRLGHRNIQNTLLYVSMEDALFEGECQHISKVAKNTQEALKLVDAGFEFVTKFGDEQIFRKRKL
jgi:integrase